MTVIEFLQAGDSAFAVIGGLFAATLFVWRWRSSAIQSVYRDLALTWTNEGDISGVGAPYVHLALQYTHGELYGTLTSPQFDESYDAHIQPGWFSSSANISLLRGRSVEQIAKFEVRLTGNKNRLRLSAKSAGFPEFLPRTAELWPSPLQETDSR